MKHVRKHLTVGNAIAAIALFLAVGGASALAAGQLAKNSVGARQLKAGAVTSAKLKNRSVTAAKVKDGAITGSKIAVATLPKVPAAVNADNASHATSASNADTVGGMHVSRIDFRAAPGTPQTVVFQGDGLTLIAECSTTSDLEFRAISGLDNSEIYESGNFASQFDGGLSNDFDSGEIERVGREIGDDSEEEVQGQLVFSNAAGGVVTAQFSLEALNGHDTQQCALEGTATYS
jgi:hypothetical protein